jgi:conjugative transfer signal peptidase TraF
MRRFLRGFALTAWSVSLLVLGLDLSGARINETASLPLGLYWAVDAPLERGSVVMFCPPEIEIFDEAKARGYIGAGFCDGGYEHMMKKVLAMSGDHVKVSNEGVFVNNELLPDSKPLSADPAGRPMPAFRVDCTLENDQVLVMSGYNPLSFDSRYFGPIRRGQIRSVVRPVLTW